MKNFFKILLAIIEMINQAKTLHETIVWLYEIIKDLIKLMQPLWQRFKFVVCNEQSYYVM